MWKSTPDTKPTTTPNNTQSLPTPARPSLEPVRSKEFQNEMAHIGKSVIIRGELSGSEDLYLDGEVEGNISLLEHNLIVGPNGRVRANIIAKDVVVHGKVDGNIQGHDRVELKKSAVLSGDISTQRIVIEDGAFFKGAIVEIEPIAFRNLERDGRVKRATMEVDPNVTTAIISEGPFDATIVERKPVLTAEQFKAERKRQRRLAKESKQKETASPEGDAV